MFRMIWRKVKFWQALGRIGSGNSSPTRSREDEISTSLASNLDRIRNTLSQSSDLVIRQFQLGTKKPLNAAVVFIDGLVDSNRVQTIILKPLLVNVEELESQVNLTPSAVIASLESYLPVADIRRVSKLSGVEDRILMGTTVILIDGATEAISSSTRGWPERKVGEPDTESVVRGPREGFVETMRMNTALLRKRLRAPGLTFETSRVGERTKTEVCIAYIQGIANPKLVEEVKTRLKAITTDEILGSGILEEFIEDNPFSIFATIGNTERPDVTAAKLLEGRVAIIEDGTPMVLTLPFLFVESFQSPEDYYSRPFYSTAVRWIRYFSYFLSVFLPPLFVALSSFHQELIPTPLIITIAASREGTPFPVVIEALVMGLIFEILREAGVRMPRPVGQAVSIVGALVIGEAAVSAGLVGAPMIMVVALTAIASFVVPPQTDSGVILRFVFTIVAGLLGAYGLILGFLGLLVHLASLRSFGVPYLSPLAPLSLGDLKDVLIRAPMWAMSARPRLLGWQDPQRQEAWQIPSPPEHGDGGKS